MTAFAVLALAALLHEVQGPATPLIEKIDIVVEDVFEDGGITPDSRLYRLANQLHVETRERVIRRELLFKEGDPLDAEALAETERNLRALPFLRRASVQSYPADPGSERGGRRVLVTVADSWSTNPDVHLAKVGNAWVWAIGGSEGNLFGWGKEIAALYSSDLDRNQTRLLYRDPRLVGSRAALTTFYSAASDGHQAVLQIQQPFYALSSRWSFVAGLEDFTGLDPLYDSGERVEDLRHTRTRYDVGAARAVRMRPTSAVRLHAGYQYSDDLVETDRRTFGIVQVGATSVSHSFLEIAHLNRFERTEDINVGNEASAFVGLSTPALGGEPGDAYFFSFSERLGVAWGSPGFLIGSASWQARHRQHAIENSIARFRVDLVQKLSDRKVLLAKANLLLGDRLDPEVQIRLGAENGLRGYPVRQFNGNRSLLVGAEGRWFAADDVLRLVSLGVAGFVDSGFAWPEGQQMSLHDLRSDLGVSLLFGVNRVAASQGGARIDFAYALNPIEGRSHWLVSAGSQIGF